MTDQQGIVDFTLDVAKLIPSSVKDLRETVPTAKGRIGFAERRERFERCMAQRWKSAARFQRRYRGYKLIICGGGTSIEKCVKDIRKQTRVSNRVKIMSLNKTDPWLRKYGIEPDFACMADPAEHVATYMKYSKNTVYLLGSTLHDLTLEQFRGRDNAYLWHPTNDDEGDGEWFNQRYPRNRYEWACISGKSTVGLRSITLAGTILGFSEIELMGFDSCDAPRPLVAKYPTYAEARAAMLAGAPRVERKLYPYDKPNMVVSYKNAVMQSKAGGELCYEANEHMVRQSYEFFDALADTVDRQMSGAWPMYSIKVAGDGAIPWLAWKIPRIPGVPWMQAKTGGIHANPERMFAKYGDAKYWDYGLDIPADGPFEKPKQEMTGPSSDDIARLFAVA